MLLHGFTLALLSVFTLAAPSGNCPSLSQLDLYTASVDDLLKGLSCGSFKSSDLVKTYIRRIKEVNHLNAGVTAVIEISPTALNDAAESDTRYKRKQQRTLEGIPVLVKDLFNTLPEQGMQSTAGSSFLLDVQVKEEAWIITSLRKQGAIILGKANMDEFANSRETLPTGFSPRGGQTLNPFAGNTTPSGSSGGSAVSTALGLAAFTLGSDTTGSISGPSSNAGVFGLRTSQGFVSTRGVMPFYPARDSAGPITRHASDLAYAMNAIAQRDSKNPHWDSKAPKTPDFTKSMIGHLKGLRVGVIDQGVKPDKGSAEEQFVYDVYAEQNRRLKALGATMVKADLPHELVEALSDNVPGQNATALDLAGSMDNSDAYEAISAYLKDTLVNSPCVTLECTIKWFQKHEQREDVIDSKGLLLWEAMVGQHAYTPPGSKRYEINRSYALRAEKLMKAHLKKLDVDVIVFNPLVGFSSYGWLTAWAWPALTVPTGAQYTKATDAERPDKKSWSWPWKPLMTGTPGMPIGLVIAGMPYSDADLIRVAYALDVNYDLQKGKKPIAGAKPCSQISHVLKNKSCKVR